MAAWETVGQFGVVEDGIVAVDPPSLTAENLAMWTHLIPAGPEQHVVFGAERIASAVYRIAVGDVNAHHLVDHGLDQPESAFGIGVCREPDVDFPPIRVPVRSLRHAVDVPVGQR
jgi:hypothetical protein